VGFRSPAPKARPEEGGPSYPSRTLGPFPRQTCKSPADPEAPGRMSIRSRRTQARVRTILLGVNLP
jgi:hypothetical protein